MGPYLSANYVSDCPPNMAQVSVLSDNLHRTEVLRASYAWTQSYLAITLYIIYLLISDYSMMEATRPEPTVRPPSRYQTSVLQCANSNFSYDLWGKIRIFRYICMIFGNFVIMVLSRVFHPSTYLYL